MFLNFSSFQPQRSYKKKVIKKGCNLVKHQEIKTCFVLCSKLQDLVPQEEMDLLSTQESWKPLGQSEYSSQVMSNYSQDN